MIVVDASVVVKWLIPEAGELAARELMVGEPQFIAPAIIRSEVAGAVLRAWRDERITRADADRALEEWERLLDTRVIDCIGQDELFDLAVKIAFETRHPLHDCFYLALGRSKESEVVTADRNLQHRGKRAGGRVTLLAGLADG